MASKGSQESETGKIAAAIHAKIMGMSDAERRERLRELGVDPDRVGDTTSNGQFA